MNKSWSVELKASCYVLSDQGNSIVYPVRDKSRPNLKYQGEFYICVVSTKTDQINVGVEEEVEITVLSSSDLTGMFNVGDNFELFGGPSNKVAECTVLQKSQVSYVQHD